MIAKKSGVYQRLPIKFYKNGKKFLLVSEFNESDTQILVKNLNFS